MKANFAPSGNGAGGLGAGAGAGAVAAGGGVAGGWVAGGVWAYPGPAASIRPIAVITIIIFSDFIRAVLLS
jgi:hypothetical protein